MFIKKNKILKIINKNIDDLEPEIKITNPKNSTQTNKTLNIFLCQNSNTLPQI